MNDRCFFVPMNYLDEDHFLIADLESGTWRGSAKIPVDYLPSKVDRFMAASKHGYGQQRVVETLYPVEGKPGDKIDLHQV